jgi:hypothetical protein
MGSVDVRNKYMASFGIMSLACQFYVDITVFNNTISFSYIGYFVSAITSIASFFPEFETYIDNYKEDIQHHISLKFFFQLLFILLLINSAVSGICAYLSRDSIVSGVIGVMPWITIHFIVAFCIITMLYATISRLTDNFISYKEILSSSLISALISVIIITPTGTIGWFVSKYFSSNQLTALLIVSTLYIFSNAIVIGILTHYLVITFPKQATRKSILRGIEFIVATASLFGIVEYFITMTGDMSEEMKKPPIILLCFQYFLLFLAVYHISFFLTQKTIKLKKKSTYIL